MPAKLQLPNTAQPPTFRTYRPVIRSSISSTTKWTESLCETAKQTLHRATILRARLWISDTTLEAHSQARNAEAAGKDGAKTLRNRAKRLAKQRQNTMDPPPTHQRPVRRGFLHAESREMATYGIQEEAAAPGSR